MPIGNFPERGEHRTQLPNFLLWKIIEIQNRVSDVNLDQEKVRETILKAACDLTGATGAVIEFQEPGEMVYVDVCGSIPTSAVGLRLKSDSSLSGLCVRENKILLCPDTEQDSRVDKTACRNLGVRSMIVLPLETTRSVVGVLKVVSGESHFFSDTDLEVLSMVAGFFARSLRQAEAASTRMHQFEVLANSLPQLAWIANADGWIHWYNKRWYEFTGTDLKEMQGWGWESVQDPELLQTVIERWKYSIATGTNFEMTLRLRSKAGDFRTFLTRGIPIKDSNQNVISWFGTNTDIEELKRAEENLRISQERYATLTEAIPQLVWTCLPSGQCNYLSHQWERYTGIPVLEQLGFNWLDRVIHPDDRDRTLNHWLGAVRGDHSYDNEYRVKSSSGEYRWFKARATPMRDELGQISLWVGTCTDVHDQKLSAYDLLKAKEDAERANEIKTAFIANMSHEIRTPLGAMMGFADLLGEPGLNSAERANYIDILHRNGEQLGRVINDILDLSKVETGHVNFEYMRVKPLQIVHEVVSLMSVLAKERDIALSFEDDGSTPKEVVSDPTRMRQVLMNLVGNALKFTKVGSIKISISGYDGLDFPKCCAFEVSDTGAGISEHSVSNLFKMFTQADNSITRKYGGTGLGLVLSRSLARAMGGDVRLINTEVGRGSTFRFSIESRDNLLSASDAIDSSLATSHNKLIPLDALSKKKILLVEDSADNQQLIWRYLTKYGATVEFADNGLEGVAKAMNGDHDLVLMDLQMPIMDGYTAVGKLRAKGYLKPLIALTAHAMADVQKKCRDIGCTDHLPKPIDSRQLIEAILKHTANPKLNS